jgi:hypothetical protein
MKRQLGWLITLGVLSASGCASLSAQRARTRIMETEVGGYRYRQSPEAIWPQVQRLLADFGLKLGGKDAEAVGQPISTLGQIISVAKETSPTPGGGLVLESDWTNGGKRWRAEARPDGDGSRVVLTQITADPTNHGHDGWSKRDLDLELTLLRRIDPETAARIDDLMEPPGASPPTRVAEPAPAPPSPAAPPPAIHVPAVRVE